MFPLLKRARRVRSAPDSGEVLSKRVAAPEA